MTKVRGNRIQAKYKALDMAGLPLKVAVKAIDHHTRAGYTKEHPGLVSVLITTAAANFATLAKREIAEAEQVTTINVKAGEQTA